MIPKQSLISFKKKKDLGYLLNKLELPNLLEREKGRKSFNQKYRYITLKTNIKRHHTYISSNIQ